MEKNIIKIIHINIKAHQKIKPFYKLTSNYKNPSASVTTHQKKKKTNENKTKTISKLLKINKKIENAINNDHYLYLHKL